LNYTFSDEIVFFFLRRSNLPKPTNT